MPNKKDYVNVPRLPFSFVRVDMGTQLPLVDHVIRQRGTPLSVTPHVICPCIVPAHHGGTGQAIPDCPSCSGTGFAYVETQSFSDVAVVSDVAADDTPSSEGRLTIGAIKLTFPSNVIVGEGDRIKLVKTLVQVRHIRRYKKAVGGIRLPFDVREVRILVTSEPTTDELIPLKQGKDFTFSQKDNLLVFPKDGIVKDNAIVSGVFQALPYYIISQMTSAFRGQSTTAFSSTGEIEWAKMPQSAIAVRADILFGRFQKDVSKVGDALHGEGS